MTRSEIIAEAIRLLKNTIAQFQGASGVLRPAGTEVRFVTLKVLLAEQKRSEGCAFCRNKENEHGFFIDGNVLFYEDGKLGTEGIIITTCPHCGRDLTEGESV